MNKPEEIFNKYAHLYQDKFMNVNLYGETFDYFIDKIPERGEILEVGCGPGNITKYILNKRPGLHYLATDLAPNMVALAKANNPSADFRILDAKNISSVDEIFDGIIGGFILPYLSIEETEIFISGCAKLIRSKGVIYLSTMEDDYHKSGLFKGSGGEEMMMHFYREKDLKNILHNNGFSIVYIKRVESEMTTGKKVVDLVIIATKQ